MVRAKRSKGNVTVHGQRLNHVWPRRPWWEFQVLSWMQWVIFEGLQIGRELPPGSHRNVCLCEVGTTPNCLSSPSPLSYKLVSAGTHPQEAISLWSMPQSYLSSLLWISPRPYLWNAVIWGIPVCFCCKVCSPLHYYVKPFPWTDISSASQNSRLCWIVRIMFPSVAQLLRSSGSSMIHTELYFPVNSW